MTTPLQPIERRIRTNGITLALFEWHRDLRGRDAPILLTHATGFHARCWDRVIHRLGERYVVAVDQRGHGRSDKIFPVHWREFGRDLADVVRTLDLHDVIGVGHSMGGHATTEAAAALAHHFERLVLIDPVIGAPEAYAAAAHLAEIFAQAPHPTAKRRNHWESAAEMFKRFEQRPPFSEFNHQVLRDYCEYGLLPNPEGDGYVLACPPRFEADVYMSSYENAAVYDSVAAVEAPVFIVRAMEPPPDRGMMDFRYS
ncbi:MAG: alpha/beta hydrolase, partial [Deltaproteobacteria bacterium]|nr:alpha/beta hydrolase [Deltaproteobacteria bacterium]